MSTTENELGWDDSEFSVFTPTPEDVEGTPLYNGFVKTDRIKAVPSPLSENYIPLSDPTDLDESQMTYGPKQTHTSDSEPKTSNLDSCESNSSSNLSAESPEFIPKSVCARNESVRKADNPRKNNKSPRGYTGVEQLKEGKSSKLWSVNSVKDTRVHTARPKTEVNTDKASASWVWRPKQEVIDHVINSPCYHNKELASPEQTSTVLHGSSPFLGANGLTSRRVNGYLYKVPTGSTQFLLVVRFSLPGLLESPGLMESIKRHSE
ncbi:hypothetical protein Tco_0099232 [Tanacetum coccineum]